MTLTAAVNTLKTYDNYLLITHRNPDGDTLCSAAALCSALRRLGKNAFLFPNPDITPKFSPFVSEYISSDSSYEYVISVDTSTDGMFCNGFSGHVNLCFDHHPSNSGYADDSIVKSDYASCGELIYELIKKLNGNLTKEEADLLYIAVSTDTGCFQYYNANQHTFEVAEKLIKAGAENGYLNQVFFRKTSLSRLKLESMILDSLSFYLDNRVCVAFVTLEMLKRSGATENDMDDVASIAGRVEGCSVSMTIREKEKNVCKVSVRSGTEVNSSTICSYFGGGGHAMAAGCTVYASPEKTRDMLISVAQEVMR